MERRGWAEQRLEVLRLDREGLFEARLRLLEPFPLVGDAGQRDVQPGVRRGFGCVALRSERSARSRLPSPWALVARSKNRVRRGPWLCPAHYF